MAAINNSQEDSTKRNAEISQQVKTATRTNLFQRLAARFGFGIRKTDSKTKSSFKIIQKPTPEQLAAKGTAAEIQLIDQLFKGNLSSTIQDLYQEWVEDTQNTYRNIEEREERLNALTYMCSNEGLVEKAVTLVASEVAALTDNAAFTVTSEDEEWQTEKNILLKDVWKYDQPTIYSLAWDIFLYGEAFQGCEMSSAGIVGIDTLKVNEIVERLEFKPSEVANFLAQMHGGGQATGFSVNLTMPTNGSFATNNLNFNYSKQNVYRSTSDLLKDYIKNIADFSAQEFFTSHLLGYRIQNDEMVAPWQVIHYRFNEHSSEFWPYGRPPLLACLSAYKQLQRVMGLDDLRSLLNMPIHMYKVKTGGATTARAFDIVNTVKEEYENVGLMSASAGMEGPSLCTNIWTSDDLVSIEKVGGDGSGDSGSTDKMKFFKDRLATATGIPMSYLDPTSESFQMSGVALAALFQPFRTLIENIRAIITSEVADRIRLHDSIRNVETPEFVITMNVQNPVATDDLSSKLQLADTVLDAVAGLLGVEDKAQLPQTVKKDVLSKYGGLSITELDKYVSTLDQEGVEKSEISQDEMDADFDDGGGFGDGGGDDFGGGEDTGGDEGMEESTLRRKRNRLIEARYRAAANGDSLKYYLVEKLGRLELPKSTSTFNSNFNSRMLSEAAKFLRSRPKTKHGKKRLES